MPMDKEQYEEILNKLNDPEINHSDRTELLQSLRTDYTQVHEDHTKHEQSIAKFQKDNNDLIISNSKLFRQMGIVGDEKMQEKEEQATFSESVTLEQLEKNSDY